MLCAKGNTSLKKLFQLLMAGLFLVAPEFSFAVDHRSGVDMSSTASFSKSMECSLWTFASPVWNGYVDFRGSGQYYTHWGMGHWTADRPGHILMTNDYDPYQHEITVMPDGMRYSGSRSDGIDVSGELIYKKYQEDLVIGNSKAEQTIQGFYRDLLGREPDSEGFRYWMNQYKAGVPLETIKDEFLSSPEYQSRKEGTGR